MANNEYEAWFLGLRDKEQVDVLAMVNVLEIKGPELARPYADTLKGTSKVRNLKELIIQHAGKPFAFFMPLIPSDEQCCCTVAAKMERKTSSSIGE